MKYARNNNGTVVKYNTLPSTWENIINFPKADAVTLETKGFFPVEEPAVGQYQRLENLIPSDFNSGTNYFTHRIYNSSTAEKQAEMKAASEANKQEVMQAEIEKSVIASAHAETDTQTILDKQDLYPFWEAGIEVEMGEKYQAFDGLVLKLYEVVQPHFTQIDWAPNLTPALWTRVAFGDEILAFVQPTGAQDAYNTGAKVHFPTLSDPVYESLIDANVWTPLVYAAGWQQL
jgi:hypothetical protein